MKRFEINQQNLSNNIATNVNNKSMKSSALARASLGFAVLDQVHKGSVVDFVSTDWRTIQRLVELLGGKRVKMKRWILSRDNEFQTQEK